MSSKRIPAHVAWRASIVGPIAFGIAALCLPASAAACPVLNGSYVKRHVENGETIKLTSFFQSKFENGSWAFRLAKNDETYFAADNVARPLAVHGFRMTVKLRCTGNTLRIEVVDLDSGETEYQQIKTLSDAELEIASDLKEVVGRYQKE